MSSPANSCIIHPMAPILDPHTLEFVSRNPAQTHRLGVRLGALLPGGAVVCLEGPLGAGKTRFAQGIGRGWGAEQTLISPTFVLVREYDRAEDDVRLYHVDLYRISGAEEAFGLGLDDFLGDERAVCLIEWAERARSLIPPEHLWVRLAFADGDPLRRIINFTAQGERHAALLRRFRREAFGV